MTTLQIRIDEKMKKDVKKIFDKLGLDMSSAIKVYLKQVVITQGIPFPLLTENGMTSAQEQAILKASEEAKAGINVEGPFETEEEIKAYFESIK